MTPYEFGDLILINLFPYSHLQEGKKRPAMVLADTGDEDLILGRVTSESPRDRYDFKLDGWKGAGLLLPSSVRLAKIATLSKRLVVRKLGRVGTPDRRKIRSLLRDLFVL